MDASTWIDGGRETGKEREGEESEGEIDGGVDGGGEEEGEGRLGKVCFGVEEELRFSREEGERGGREEGEGGGEGENVETILSRGRKRGSARGRGVLRAEFDTTSEGEEAKEEVEEEWGKEVEEE